MKRITLTLTLLFLPLLLTAGEIPESVVAFTLSTDHVTLSQGGEAEVRAEIKIKPTWHIYGFDGNGEDFIPTALAAGEGFVLKGIKAPPTQSVRLSFSPEPLSVYESGLTVAFRVEAKQATIGAHSVPVTLTYQACNNALCLPPEEVTRTLNVEVTAGSAVPTETPANNRVMGWIEGRGMLAALLLLFLSGLALNLTPCVYPMIPITLGFFRGQVRDTKRSVMPLALLYFLGITLTYSILGTVAALTGGFFGNMLQNPVILIVVAVILVVLSLSMFDLYTLQLPSSVTSRLSGKAGLAGAFIMGALVGLVAAPCIGPVVLGLLTAVAALGSPVKGFILFFALSAGLGAPYLILGAFSGSMQKLPHSGTWMATIERIFGFLLLVAAVYMVHPLLPDGWDTILYALLGLACGIVLIFFMPTGGESSGWRTVRRVLGVLFIIGGIALGITTLKPHPAKNEGPWKSYSDEALSTAEAAHRPVVIDFFADWCLPCKELDHKTFSDPGVQKLLKQIVPLKADLTRSNDPKVKALVKTYGIKGVPTIVFIGRDGKVRDDLGFVGFLDADDFKKKIETLLTRI